MKNINQDNLRSQNNFYSQNYFRPMNAGDILDRTLLIYRQRFSLLIPIPLISFGVNVFLIILFAIIAVIVAILLGAGKYFSQNPSPALLVPLIPIAVLFVSAWIFAFFYVVCLTGGAMVRLVSELFLNREATWKGAVYFAIIRMKDFLGALTLASLIFLIWWGPALIIIFLCSQANFDVTTNITIMAIVLGIAIIISIIYSLKYMFAPQIVMLENKKGMDVLRRSEYLFSKAPWRMLGIYLLLSLLPYVLILPIRLIPFIGRMLESIVSIFIVPITFIGMTLLYYDMRIRFEGFDLVILAEELGA